MRKSSFESKDKSGWNVGGGNTGGVGGVQETDPLIRRDNHPSATRRSSSNPDSNLRERRPSQSQPPIAVSLFSQRFGGPSGESLNMNPIPVENSNSAPALDTSAATSNTTTTQTHNNEASISSYAPNNEDGSRSGTMSLGGNSEESYHNAPACGGSNTTNSNRSVHSLQRSHLISGRDVLSRGDASGNIALLEIPEEVYRVRRAALQVLKPLTRTWVSRYFFC